MPTNHSGRKHKKTYSRLYNYDTAVSRESFALTKALRRHQQRHNSKDPTNQFVYPCRLKTFTRADNHIMHFIKQHPGVDADNYTPLLLTRSHITSSGLKWQFSYLVSTMATTEGLKCLEFLSTEGTREPFLVTENDLHLALYSRDVVFDFGPGNPIFYVWDANTSLFPLFTLHPKPIDSPREYITSQQTLVYD